MTKPARRMISKDVLDAVRELGKRLALARKRAHLSQEELASLARINRLVLSRIENGSTTTRLAAYAAILTALGLGEQLEELAIPEREPSRIELKRFNSSRNLPR